MAKNEGESDLALDSLLTDLEAETIYKFVNLLTKIGLKIEINFTEELPILSKQEKTVTV